jgi:multidrug resistance efflux pump
LAQSKRALAERQRLRIQQAHDEDAASPQALDEARDALATIDAELAGAQAAIEAARIHVRSAELELDLKTVRAPIAGRIAEQSMATRASLPVHEGTELYLLVPSAPRVVRAQIEEEFSDQVHVGMRAEIFTDSNQDRRYPAQVLRVGDILRGRDADPLSNERRDVRMMDCLLSVTAPELRVGQRVLIRFLRSS